MTKPIVSFDVFDTCLTRIYSRPIDLFLELGSRLKERGLFDGTPEGFQKVRCDVERDCRGPSSDQEVHFHEIYDRIARVLGWTPTRRDAASELELELESEALFGVPAVRRRLKQARSDGAFIVFISDMYLPSSFIQKILLREGFWIEGDGLYVSSEHHCSKGSGKLYDKVAHAYDRPHFDHWIHIGDHARSDFRVPSRKGIKANLETLCSLTARERLADAVGFSDPLHASLFSGALRNMRLLADASDCPHSDTFGLGACLVGPVLYGFVDWCLKRAVALGLRRLAFVSRDGQILQRIAGIIVEHHRYPIECRYMFGSRQAWHPAAFECLSTDEFSWIFAPVRWLTLGQVLDRLGLSRAAHSGFWSDQGLDLDVNMTPHWRERVGDWLLSPAIKGEAERIAASRRRVALGYLRQEGWLETSDWGMVDIGWAGNLQKSLSRLIQFQSPQLAGFPGFYFGLTNPHSTQPSCERFAYWNDADLNGRDILRLNQAMVEIFTAADHGTVLGYHESSNGKIIPTLASEVNTQAIEWGLADFHQGIAAYARMFARASRRNPLKEEELRRCLKSLFGCFYQRPTKTEAEALGRYPFSDQQVETRFDSMVPVWNEVNILLALVNYRLRPIGWWPEGMRACRFSPSLLAYLGVRDTWRSFRGHRFF